MQLLAQGRKRQRSICPGYVTGYLPGLPTDLTLCAVPPVLYDDASSSSSTVLGVIVIRFVTRAEPQAGNPEILLNNFEHDSDYGHDEEKTPASQQSVRSIVMSVWDPRSSKRSQNSEQRRARRPPERYEYRTYLYPFRTRFDSSTANDRNYRSGFHILAARPAL